MLRKLDRLGRPQFVLSCRAADWQGSVDKAKIEEDYGERALTLHIQPFTQEQALRFLAGYEGLDGPKLLAQMSERGLGELVGNPLTLGLLAEVALDGKGLPENKTQLLERASRLLVKESNPQHSTSSAAQARVDDLLLSAGAIMAHQLISGTLGVATGSRETVPVGFVHASEVAELANAPLAQESLGTRLFRSEGEGLFAPIYRVIAEYLGARWLSRRLENGLSERRLFEALQFGGGVPTSLRGLHAWLGYFSHSVADRCIKADPYGVLRYGETAHLPIPRARLLLTSLAALAKEDPYFRSEDWGVRAVSGLARPELKDEIVSVVRSPDRHFQLSTLLLELLPGSTLAQQIAPELLEIVTDAAAVYAERHHAAEALIASDTKIDWAKVVADLRQKGSQDDRRLGLEIISQLRGVGFTASQITDSLIDHVGIDRADKKGNTLGNEYALTHRLDHQQCAAVLDEIEARLSAMPHEFHWSPNSRLTSAIQRLVMKAVEGTPVTAGRFWAWVRFLDDRSGYSSEIKEKLGAYLKDHPDFRREVQRIALADERIDGGPWMAIVHELPQVNPNLAISQDDGSILIGEIAARQTLTERDVSLWRDLVQSLGRPENHIPL